MQQVIEELQSACRERGVDLSENIAADDPLKPVTDAVRYLGNNLKRMDYPRYRRLGLPVTSAPMESLIKQMNARVKGTETFWDDPEGPNQFCTFAQPRSAKTVAWTITSPRAPDTPSSEDQRSPISPHKLNWSR